jgi:hypothetical protein
MNNSQQEYYKKKKDRADDGASGLTEDLDSSRSKGVRYVEEFIFQNVIKSREVD